MTIKYFKDYTNFLNEGLIKTYPSNIVSNNLKNSLIGLGLNFNVEVIRDKIKLTTGSLYPTFVPIIYEIDNSTHIIDKLFIDVNYDKRVYYTLNNIPKDKIKIVKIDN